MRAHRSDADAQTVHGDLVIFGAAQDLVGLNLSLPLFAGLTVAQVRVNPGNQGAGERHTELGGIQLTGALLSKDLAVDVQNCGCGVVQLLGDLVAQVAELCEHLAHVAGTAAGSSLVGHGGSPLDQVVLEEAAQAHQQAGDGAVTADEVLHAGCQAAVDDVAVNGVQHDDGVIVHAQGGSGINPQAVPACCTQLRVHSLGVATALSGHNNRVLTQLVNVVCVLQLGRLNYAVEGGRRATNIRGGEEDGGNALEIAFLNHALHEDGAHHAAPANKTYRVTGIKVHGSQCTLRLAGAD